MITHTLHIGEMVADYENEKWGYIVLINGKEEDCLISDANRDAIVTLWDRPSIEEKTSEWETLAEDCYQVAEDKFFRGELVCKEHLRDEMTYKYPYWCPAEDENLYGCELD